MKISKTVGAVILFIALATWFLYAEPVAAGQPTISVGHTILNAHQTVGELGYRSEDHKWDASISMLGHGETKRGYTDPVAVVGVSRLMNPDFELWGQQIYTRIGVAYVDAFPLVGPWNYRLGVGARFGGKVELEYVHWSSAGINDVNTGIDGLQFRWLL